MRKFLWVTILLMGCSTAPSKGPPSVRFGQDACARCGMIISEQRFAAGYRDLSGENIAFDDVGEAFAAIRQDAALKDRLYVNDMEESDWIPAAEAFYVRVPELATPMGSGIGAFRDREQATSFAQARNAGQPLTLDALLEDLN